MWAKKVQFGLIVKNSTGEDVADPLLQCVTIRGQSGLILSVPPSLPPEPQAPNQLQDPKPTHGIMLVLMVMWSLLMPSLL